MRIQSNRKRLQRLAEAAAASEGLRHGCAHGYPNRCPLAGPMAPAAQVVPPKQLQLRQVVAVGVEPLRRLPVGCIAEQQYCWIGVRLGLQEALIQQWQPGR